MLELLLRMKRWARHPPGWRTVRIGLVVLALCALIVAIERAGLWPDWLTATRARPPAVR